MQNPAMWQMFMRGAQGPTSQVGRQALPRMSGAAASRGAPAMPPGGGMPPNMQFNAGGALGTMGVGAKIVGAGGPAPGGLPTPPSSANGIPPLEAVLAGMQRYENPNMQMQPGEDRIRPMPSGPMPVDTGLDPSEDRIRPMPSGAMPEPPKRAKSSGRKKAAQPGLLGDGTDEDWLMEFFRRNAKAANSLTDRNSGSNR